MFARLSNPGISITELGTLNDLLKLLTVGLFTLFLSCTATLDKTDDGSDESSTFEDDSDSQINEEADVSDQDGTATNDIEAIPGESIEFFGYVQRAFNIKVNQVDFNDTEDFYTRFIDKLIKSSPEFKDRFEEAEIEVEGEYSLERFGSSAKIFMSSMNEDEGYIFESVTNNEAKFTIEVIPKALDDSYRARVIIRIGLQITEAGVADHYCYILYGLRENIKINEKSKPIIFNNFTTQLNTYRCQDVPESSLEIPEKRRAERAGGDTTNPDSPDGSDVSDGDAGLGGAEDPSDSAGSEAEVVFTAPAVPHVEIAKKIEVTYPKLPVDTKYPALLSYSDAELYGASYDYTSKRFVVVKDTDHGGNELAALWFSNPEDQTDDAAYQVRLFDIAIRYDSEYMRASVSNGYLFFHQQSFNGYWAFLSYWDDKGNWQGNEMDQQSQYFRSTLNEFGQDNATAVSSVDITLILADATNFIVHARSAGKLFWCDYLLASVDKINLVNCRESIVSEGMTIHSTISSGAIYDDNFYILDSPQNRLHRYGNDGVLKKVYAISPLLMKKADQAERVLVADDEHLYFVTLEGTTIAVLHELKLVE